MKKQIEKKVFVPPTGENARYARKKRKKAKQDIFDNAKPKEGTRLYALFRDRKDRRQRSYGIQFYKGCMSRTEFIDEYLKALYKRPDILPNIYCSRAWLLAHENIIPMISALGYMSFCDKEDTFHFFLPAYKYMDDDKVFFKAKEAYATFPLSLGREEGIRYDVQYMYTRDVSVYMIPKILKVRNTMKTIPYKTYAIPYTDHSKDEVLKTFLNTYKERCASRCMTEDLEGFEKMLFQPFGQHRYVIQRTDNDRICAVLLWEDTGEVINMLYTVGIAERPYEYGYTDKEWRVFRRKACLRYPETILRYEFMKSFPRGTVFNGGGCGSSEHIKFMQVISQPSHIFDIRTNYSIICKKDKVGLLPGEFFLPVKKASFWIDCANKVLFAGCQKKFSAISSKELREKQIKHFKRRVCKFLVYKKFAEKFLKKSKNNT